VASPGVRRFRPHPRDRLEILERAELGAATTTLRGLVVDEGAGQRGDGEEGNEREGGEDDHGSFSSMDSSWTATSARAAARPRASPAS